MEVSQHHHNIYMLLSTHKDENHKTRKPSSNFVTMLAICPTSAKLVICKDIQEHQREHYFKT
jgi:hypothetical protein